MPSCTKQRGLFLKQLVPVIGPRRKRLAAFQTLLNIAVIMQLAQHMCIILFKLFQLIQHMRLLRVQQCQNILNVGRFVCFIGKELLQLRHGHARVFETADGFQSIDMLLAIYALAGGGSSHVCQKPKILIIAKGRSWKGKQLRELPDAVLCHILACFHFLLDFKYT